MNKVKQITVFGIVAVLLSANHVDGAEGAPAPAKGPPGGKDSKMKIFSQSMNYNLGKRMAIYEGEVRVVDQSLDLRCDKLTVLFHPNKPANDPKGVANPAPKPPVKEKPDEPLPAMSGTGGKVKMLIAEGNVVILDLANKARALGDKAVYTSLTEQVELTSIPGRPLPKIIDKDENVLVSKVIIYDRRTQDLKANQGVQINQDPPQKTPREKVPGKKIPEPPVRRFGSPKQ